MGTLDTSSYVTGSLVPSGDIHAGSMYLYDPKLYPKEHQRYDIDFKRYCCGAAGLCDEYRKRRPSSNCTGYAPSKTGELVDLNDFCVLISTGY